MSEKLIVKKIKKATQGFTLIELLVVISIIAILAVVSLSLFGNAQKVARDAARKAEINAIAKSIESARDIPNSSYSYDNTKFTNDFGNGAPKDSLGTTEYCYQTSATGIPLDATASTWANGCPTGWTIINSSITMNAVRYWKVCAKLEATVASFCLGSLVR